MSEIGKKERETQYGKKEGGKAKGREKLSVKSEPNYDGRGMERSEKLQM